MENADCPPEGVEIHNSDHGGEVIASKDFQQWLGQRGIFWRSAPRITPNYNGVVERNIYTNQEQYDEDIFTAIGLICR